jgi:hypothetical protein
VVVVVGLPLLAHLLFQITLVMAAMEHPHQLAARL